MSRKDQKANSVTESTVPKAEVTTADMDNSPGKQLTAAREALGLSQQQVADRLHLRINSIKAVEQDELEPTVSVTFNKGYVRLYARLVHLDVQTLLEAYDRIHVQDKTPAKLQSFSRKITRETHDHRWNMVTIVVVLLVIGSVIGWWIQQSDSLKDSQDFVSDTFDSLFTEPQSTTTELDAQKNQDDFTDRTEPVDFARQDNGPLIPDLTVSDSDEIKQNLDEGFTSADQSINEDDDLMVDLTDDEQKESQRSDSTINDNELGQNDAKLNPQQSLLIANGYDVNADGTVNIVFTFKDDCWVSVKDVNGEVMAIGVKDKGRVMAVSGLPPIDIILGTAKAVEINFAGKDVDMSAYPDTRTANFQLPIESE